MSKIELFENERAAAYNNFVQAWIPNYNSFMDWLPRLLSSVDRKELLVVGCGTGNEIERFVKAGDSWQITGVDPSPEMLDQAKVKFAQYDQVTLREGVVTAIDRDKKFSAATLLLVLHFLEDDGSKLELLKDIADRLEPKAPLVLLDIAGDKQQIRQNLDILKLILPENITRDQIDMRVNRIAHELFAVSEKRLSELCAQAGFDKPLRFFQSSVYLGWLMMKK